MLFLSSPPVLSAKVVLVARHLHKPDPKNVQVEVSPLLECEKQDCWVLVERIRILGNGGGMSSTTEPPVQPKAQKFILDCISVGAARHE